MQRVFRAAVYNSGAPVAAMTGNRTERFERAAEAIDALLLANAADRLREDDPNS